MKAASLSTEIIQTSYKTILDVVKNSLSNVVLKSATSQMQRNVTQRHTNNRSAMRTDVGLASRRRRVEVWQLKERVWCLLKTGISLILVLLKAIYSKGFLTVGPYTSIT